MDHGRGLMGRWGRREGGVGATGAPWVRWVLG